MQRQISWQRWVKQAPAALLVSCWLNGLAVTVAIGHSVVMLRSEPRAGAALAQPPTQVKLWFTEELQSKGSTLQIFTATGQPVLDSEGGLDLTDPDHATLLAPLPTLATGIYTVCWQAYLIDGDRTTGGFAFGVGVQPEQPFVCPQVVISKTASAISWPWLVAGGLGILFTTVFGLTWRKAAD